MKVIAGIRNCDVVDAVLDLAAVAVVLTLDACGVLAALGRSGLINAADRVGVGILGGDHSLATSKQPLFIPNDGFQESLQRSGGDALVECNRFGVLSWDIRNQSTDIDGEQASPRRTRETFGKKNQKLGKQFSERCDILKRHGTALRGFRVKCLSTRRVVSFRPASQGQ